MNLRTRTWLGDNHYEVTIGLESGEQPLAPDQLVTLWEDMGVCRVLSERARAAPWLTAERASTERVAVVETLETVGQLPNRGVGS